MLQSTITSKGQITIPAVIREKLHLSSGNKLEFFFKDDYMIIVPVNKSIRELKGILPKPDISLSCNEMNQIIREAHDRD